MATENRTNKHSAFHSIGARPSVITGYLRQWFMQHFSREAYIENPELRGMLWSRLIEESKIDVESITRWKPQTTGLRPAIIISRNDYTTERRGVNDQIMADLSQPVTGNQHHANYILGSHTLFCTASKGEEAEILASEVYRELNQFGPAIRIELGLMKFVTVQLGKLFEIEEARENYAVPVTVGCMAEERWKLIPHAPFLKRIVLSAFLP